MIDQSGCCYPSKVATISTRWHVDSVVKGESPDLHDGRTKKRVAIAQLVEAPIDWIDELPDSVDRARLRRFVDQAQDSYEHLMFPGWAVFRLTNMAKDITGDEKETQYTAITAYGYFRDGPSFGVRVLDELHNLLCRNDSRYKMTVQES